MSDPLVVELAGMFAQVTGSTPPPPDADLLDGGLLDSLALVELLFSIEQQLGVRITGELLEIDRFRTLTTLAALVRESEAASADAVG